METEIWKAVPGYEDYYEVSTQGRVRSLDRVISRSDGTIAKLKGKLRSQRLCQGYPNVTLHKEHKRWTAKVHRLVAITFLGEFPDLQVNHIDGCRTNNNINNLEWVTPAENMKNAIDRGVMDGSRQRGEKNCRAKFTEEQVKYIRSLDMTLQEIADIFGVAYSTIYNIKSKKTWAHI